MCRVTLFLAFVAMTFSLAISASPKKDNKEGTTRMMDVFSEKDAEQAMQMFTAALRECNETFTIEKSYLASLNDSGSFLDETDRTPKCYVRCILEKMGAASEDGVYDPAMMALVLALIRPEGDSSGFEKITTTCNDRKETCKCDRAYQYVKCVLQEEIKRESRSTMN